MSRTVVVLETAGPEYRVRLIDNPEQLYRGINANTSRWIPNSEYIHEQFDGIMTYHGREAALHYARYLSQLPGNADLEGGIQVIDIWSDIEYPNL